MDRVSSSELGCAAAPGRDFLSWLHEEGEERLLVLTDGEHRQSGDGMLPTAVNGGGG
jgi:hypothetical protein